METIDRGDEIKRDNLIIVESSHEVIEVESLELLGRIRYLEFHLEFLGCVKNFAGVFAAPQE